MTEWIMSSCFLIAVVLLLRAALGRRISAGLRYGLWLVVLARLLTPVSIITLSFTVPQFPEVMPPAAMQEKSIYVLPVDRSPVEESGVFVLEDGKLGDPNSFGYPKLSDSGKTVVRYAEKISPLELLGWLWKAGAVVMGTVLIAANVKFYCRLRRMRKRLEDVEAPVPVYLAEGVPSPCLFGLIRPSVYVTENAAANPVMLHHVLCHELTHYKHFDHIWSALRGAALAVHWWNPLVWAAVVCSRRDSELACDEGALKHLGDGERTAYGETLLALVTEKRRPGDLFTCATTMSGGKRSLQERIRRIARQPKQLVSAMVAVIAVLSLTVLVAFGQGKDTGDADAPEPNTASPVSAGASVAWENTDITLDENGIVHVIFENDFGVEEIISNPIPAPREWAEQEDLAGRTEATTLIGSPDIRAQMVSTSDGWLVVTYGHGVAAADTYVYKTTDSGMSWTEVTMPGTNWHLSVVGFLGTDRLLIAQRLFDGAPCVITKDGGETWEEISLPDRVVTTIMSYNGTVTLYVAPNETGPTTYRMITSDYGDHWEVKSTGEVTADSNDNSNYAEDHPDDVWSPLADVLENLTPEDIGDISAQKAVTAEELAELLKETSDLRSSRYHAYRSFEAEEVWTWSMAEWAVPLTAGGTLHLMACDSGNVEMSYETEEGAFSAFYYQPKGLHTLILRAGTIYPERILPYDVDLDRDGKSDELVMCSESDDDTAWLLQCRLSSGGTWETEAASYPDAWNAVFLCQRDGEDHLLQYLPNFDTMNGDYRYKLFYLDQKTAREVVVQENALEFRVNWIRYSGKGHASGDPVFGETSPKEIAAFMDEINALLADSTQLLNTNRYLKGSFTREGRLYDRMAIMRDAWDSEKTMLENLLAYRNQVLVDSAVGDVRVIDWVTEESIVTASLEDGTPVSKEEIASILQGDRSTSFQVKGEWVSEYPVIVVQYTTPEDPGEQTITLQAGMSGKNRYVHITWEGVRTVVQYSENPDVEGMYLKDVPYSMEGFIETSKIYDRIVELSKQVNKN